MQSSKRNCSCEGVMQNDDKEAFYLQALWKYCSEDS